MIRLDNVSVFFDQGTPLEKKALVDLTLQIPEGQFVTVIGGNGAGKSTLLNIITGELFPTTGKVYFEGKEVTDYDTPKRTDFISRVFQDPLKGTCANLTIEENMALAFQRGQQRGLGFALTKLRRLAFKDHLKRLGLGLENRLQEPVGSLSGGQRQALALGMAMLSPSKILLLDEHTAALDPKTAAFIIHLTKEIVAEEGLTTVMVTHSMHQALELGSRTIMLAEGHIVLDLQNPSRQKLTPHDLLGEFEKWALE